jgi:hypothetical protein
MDLHNRPALYMQMRTTSASGEIEIYASLASSIGYRMLQGRPASNHPEIEQICGVSRTALELPHEGYQVLLFLGR